MPGTVATGMTVGVRTCTGAEVGLDVEAEVEAGVSFAQASVSQKFDQIMASVPHVGNCPELAVMFWLQD